MTLVKYGSRSIPTERVKQLLSYAVGSATDEKLRNILEQVYLQGDFKLYVYIDSDDSALGIIGFEGEGVSAEILHIAVDEHKRNCGIGRRMIDELLMLENLFELTAETDRDAVGFYSKYGFEIQSLGEKYPGVERFHCRLLFR
ncbi:GNAT family N-acetyltransferase [Alicyclobacillus fastidiosus]|uniref:GNAT family N-acetyltransferase n=1 Tax=Alicyclobacillus fastidiosus TaxID=392011 RepID=A0ABY6ZNK2_9BACL|nr:GNAT family N-acetyltransferase [Alicyclobacillus fastidiosus]WAH44424.1 GNAT family N-acetyltransferase [Alicyclobacillus fastidiosus]GMA60765.1 N-acetyltransferase [Alicyclobacillus fastidiosus]